ncbi:hypothetical protein VNO78_25779 [Psophocarpus tetragonolobus]|uniref:Uncharacterized protein n=1 Tax=Psophocarpus tetragonolobus TaxID=3891 RepID=A0AAN9S720_PSOTE
MSHSSKKTEDLFKAIHGLRFLAHSKTKSLPKMPDYKFSLQAKRRGNNSCKKVWIPTLRILHSPSPPFKIRLDP